MALNAKVSWSPLLVKYADNCMMAYVQASHDINAGTIFIHYVKALEALLKPDWPQDWLKERHQIILSIKKGNQEAIKDTPVKLKIEIYYKIFLRLMDMIKGADRLY